MKLKCYEDVFECTKTLQNGYERRIKKSVFCPINSIRQEVVTSDRIEQGISALKDEHYYKIEYVETKIKSIFFLNIGE